MPDVMGLTRPWSELLHPHRAREATEQLPGLTPDAMGLSHPWSGLLHPLRAREVSGKVPRDPIATRRVTEYARLPSCPLYPRRAREDRGRFSHVPLSTPSVTELTHFRSTQSSGLVGAE